MKRKTLIFFFLSLILTTSFMQFFFNHLSNQYFSSMAKETSIIRSYVRERFKLYLNSSRIVGIYVAENLSKQRYFRHSLPLSIISDYEQLSSIIIKNFDEIIGLNFLDSEGRIINIFPTDKNQKAFAKKTQHFKEIRKSALKGETCWLSPPFTLYQGLRGFAFYIPVYQRKKELLGWFAVIINQKEFINNLKLDYFLEKNHLVIRDVTTNLNYFSSTSPLPENSREVIFRNKYETYGRLIEFISWPKKIVTGVNIPFFYSFLISLFLTSLLTYTYALFLQRKETKLQFKKLNSLIKFTAQEASVNLTNIYREINLTGKGTGYISTEKMAIYVSYIITLMEQISIIKKFSPELDGPIFEDNEVYPLFTEQLELSQKKLNAKSLKVQIDENFSKSHFSAWTNKWLLSYSILGNVLKYIMFYCATNEVVDVSLNETKTYAELLFRFRPYLKVENNLQEEITNKYLAIANEVISITNGEILLVNNDPLYKTVSVRFNLK